MCGVIGLIYEKEKRNLGIIATKLLKMLEYRGYDSTGAAVQDMHGKVTLLKDVGAPSEISYKLGIDKLAGFIFCGQVRWATFGMVTRENAQPHDVRCKIHIYGAHNGNITNCHRLKEWLISEGHDVKSDNDGEMLVHTIEHFFAEELQYKDTENLAVREKALKSAALKASKKLTGSFAAVVVDPIGKCVLAMKAGSSLYIGKGNDPTGGDFVIVSSDLASVLQLTKILIPIKENEFALFSHDKFSLFELKTGKALKRASQRSLLKTEETRLHLPYKYFMEQEIFHQVKATRRLITLFTGGNPITSLLRTNKKYGILLNDIKKEFAKLAEITELSELQKDYKKLLDSTKIAELKKIVEANYDENLDVELESSHASFLEELRDVVEMGKFPLPLLFKFIDAAFDLEDIHQIETRVKKFVNIVVDAQKSGNAIYMLACGSSYHAAKTAPLFFNEIAGLPIIPLLPGEFRAQCTNSLRSGDVVIGISQSGETKDLIDVFNFIMNSRKAVKRICILNNTNSTLAVEKSDLFIPLSCGPEIAVPATKSFINQLLILYILAIKVKEGSQPSKKNRKKSEGVDENLLNLHKIPDLIDKTLKTTQKETEEIAAELFLKPSMHILATRILGIAKEGALKIREIVLNHTEGFEGSEFKHGPNTILGINTVFGMDSIKAILEKFSDTMSLVLDSNVGKIFDGRAVQKLFKAVSDYAFSDIQPKYLSEKEQTIFETIFKDHNFFKSLYDNYPLLFITCPHEQDINLTISQINTHKIRGANVFMIAEDDDMLREAVSISPASTNRYKHGYVTLPRTGNSMLSIFSTTVVLQMLALKMSQKKMEFLNRLEIESHGVHPDVPKNVSKSITVD